VWLPLAASHGYALPVMLAFWLIKQCRWHIVE
jgi:hypothetical protein